MHKSARSALILAISLAAMPAMAGTLRCTSVNGNVNCVGDGAASCQTVNGHTVCASGDGSVMQSFGDAQPPSDAADPGGIDPDMPDLPNDADGMDGLLPPPRSGWLAPQHAGRGTGKLPATHSHWE
jgi:hypothetical protein